MDLRDYIDNQGATVLNVASGYKPGDVVELKSTSLPMTVSAITPEGGVACLWMYDGRIGQGIFPPEVFKGRR